MPKDGKRHRALGYQKGFFAKSSRPKHPGLLNIIYYEGGGEMRDRTGKIVGATKPVFFCLYFVVSDEMGFTGMQEIFINLYSGVRNMFDV